MRYKRPSGTRWVAHQVDATSHFLRNLPTLLGFLHHQIQSPYNKSMKDAKATLQGHLKNASDLKILIYLAARQDILSYLSPFSQTLESEKLLAPEAITAMNNAKLTMTKISQVLEERGSAAFYTKDLLPTLANVVWSNIEDDDSASSIFRETRQDKHDHCEDEDVHTELSNKPQMFHGYSMNTSLDRALSKVT